MPIDHLPVPLRRPAERLRAWALTDAVLLVLLGLGCVARGVSYLDYKPSAVLAGMQHPAEAWMSLDAWGIVWITVGAANLVLSLKHTCRLADLAFYAAIGLHILWGLSLWKVGVWLTASWYLLFAAAIVYTLWRGSRDELRIREVRRGRP